MGQLKLNRGWEKLVAEHASVKDGSKKLAEVIAEDARGRTPVASGAARDSVEVVEADDKVYVTAGGGAAWYFTFFEFGGSGFRPPPMPIRRAASRYGRSEQGR